VYTSKKSVKALAFPCDVRAAKAQHALARIYQLRVSESAYTIWSLEHTKTRPPHATAEPRSCADWRSPRGTASVNGVQTSEELLGRCDDTIHTAWPEGCL